MKNLFLIITSVLLFNFGCKKEGPVGPMGPAGQNAAMDKQIRFELWRINSGVSDTAIFTIENSGSGINQFNIDNYAQIDSAVFVVYDIITRDICCESSDVQKAVKLELYDLTNGSVITNSEIVSDDIPRGNFVASKNIKNNFPKKTIDLGVRMIFDKKYFASTGKMYLFLYRK